MARQCKAKTKSGARCAAYAVIGSDFCLTHAPERARERAERNKRGGQVKATPRPSAGIDAPKIANVQDVLGLVNWVICDVWQQENTAPRARALLAAAAQAIECLQIGALEARVKALEELMSDGKNEHTPKAG